jgi:Ca2+-binding RTX toxin-like protein
LGDERIPSRWDIWAELQQEQGPEDLIGLTPDTPVLYELDDDLIEGLFFYKPLLPCQYDPQPFCCSEVDVVVLGTQGNDVLADAFNPQGQCVFAFQGIDIIATGTGADSVYMASGDDEAVTGGGADRVLAGNGVDLVWAGAQDDQLYGGPQTDYLIGQSGDDVIVGHDGNDLLLGGSDDDKIYPGSGNDLVGAGPGDDVVFVLDPCEISGLEILVGGPGYDVLVLPVSPEEAMALGLVAIGFEEVVVDASYAEFSSCADEGNPLDPDPDFPPSEDPPPDPGDDPEVYRPEEGCEPPLQPLDVQDGPDGEPQIFALNETTPDDVPQGSCVGELRYCAQVNGQYIEVNQRPYLSPQFEIPLQAIDPKCAGGPGYNPCPILSDGQPALACEPVEAVDQCITVEICPDEGDWADANDPNIDLDFDLPPDQHQLPDSLLPGPVIPAVLPGQPVVFDPCAWKTLAEPVFRACLAPAEDLPDDVADTLLGPGTACTIGPQCASCNCQAEVCSASPPPGVNFDQTKGSDKWNVQVKAGLKELDAWANRSFYPSQNFGVRTKLDFGLNATAFGIKVFPGGAVDVTLDSAVDACAFTERLKVEVNGNAFLLDGIHESNIGGAVDSESEFTAIDVGVASVSCANALKDLKDAEYEVNAAFHDAFIAMAHWNQGGAGPNFNKNIAQDYIDAYEQEADEYLDALAEFVDIQRSAIQHQLRTSGTTGSFRLQGNQKKGKTPVGPFKPAVEYGWVADMKFKPQAENNLVFGDSIEECAQECEDDAECDVGACEDGICAAPEDLGVGCMSLRSRVTLSPDTAALGAYAYIYAGLSLGGHAGVRGGIEGRVNILEIQSPMEVEIEMRQQMTPNDPDLPGVDPNWIDGFTVPGSVAFVDGFVRVGANAELSMMSGGLDLFLRAWLGNFKSEWRKTLTDWGGKVVKTWQLADQNTNMPLSGQTAMGAQDGVPNMVSLWRWVLVNNPGNTPHAAIDASIQTQIGAGRSHWLENLGEPWVIGPGERCFDGVP